MKKTRIRFLLSAMACLLCCGAASGAGNAVTEAYALKLWTVEDRLPGSPVVGVAQAQDGYLWLATPAQLIRFNGVEFYDVPVPEAVRQKTGWLSGVFCGQARGVWVYGADGIARYLAGEWQVWPAASAQPGTVGRIDRKSVV